MSGENKPIGIDGSGYELLTNAIRDLLNLYPGLYQDEIILFEELQKDAGIAFSADNGAIIITERKSVTGKIYQKCQYPFFVVYRTGSNLENQKIKAQAFLSTLGKWLAMESIIIDGKEYKLDKYPDLSDGREITKITRMNAYGVEPGEDGVQDWLLPCTAEYDYNYYK